MSCTPQLRHSLMLASVTALDAITLALSGQSTTIDSALMVGSNL
jgi:hypothetical protein